MAKNSSTSNAPKIVGDFGFSNPLPKAGGTQGKKGVHHPSFTESNLRNVNDRSKRG